MKVVCAPDSFKETASAAAVAKAMARGVKRSDPTAEIEICPVGDGGEGTLDALATLMGGEFHSREILGPRCESVQARFAICAGQVGIVELAEASGLSLVPTANRDPTRATSFGTGQLIAAAIDQGCSEIIVCVGGSATVDGGAGIAQALGARFFDKHDRLIEWPITGGMLSMIKRIEPPAGLPNIRVACDVTNPLLGHNGAAAIYGPQKGATPEQIDELEDGLRSFTNLAGGDPDQPGAGAAGGAAYGLATLCHATLERGIELVLQRVGFAERCRGAQLVLTGEGRLDSQSLYGKACIGVAKAAAKLGVPTIAIVGSTGPGAEQCVDIAKDGHLKRWISLSDQFGLRRAMRDAPQLIEDVAACIIEEVH